MEERRWRILSAANAGLKKRPNANHKSALTAGKRKASKKNSDKQPGAKASS
jgi:hypothetical protein